MTKNADYKHITIIYRLDYHNPIICYLSLGFLDYGMPYDLVGKQTVYHSESTCTPIA
jgi:hypothetical protein